MTATPHVNDRLIPSRRWLWIGPTAGIACMVALFTYGLAIDAAPLAVIATSVAAVLGAVWASTHAALEAKSEKAAQR